MKLHLAFVALAAVLAAFSIPRSARPLSLPEPQRGVILLNGFDVPTAAEAPSRFRALERAIVSVKDLSPAALQGAVRWSAVELREGQFDWAACDRLAAFLKQNGLRWSPNLIIGGMYATPGWVARKPGYKALQCVEHGRRAPIASPWYPGLREYAARFLKAFCERFRDSGVLESVTLGVTGFDGRAALPQAASDPSGSHMHAGLWNGDSEAERSFQVWLAAKYGGSGPLRDAWGGLTQGIPYVHPFLKRDSSTERAWIDQMDWMAESVSQYSRDLLKIVRAELPQIPIYLRTNAAAAPESGCDLALQSRAAAEAGAGLQVVCNSSEYRSALARLALPAATAAEFKAPLRVEVEGALSAPVVTSTLFSSAASGAKSIVLNTDSLARAPAAKAALDSARGFFIPQARAAEVAVYYPETSAKLLNADLIAALQPLRDRFEFDLVRESQITQAGLPRYRAMIMLQGNIAEGRALRDLHTWTRKGGLLIYPEGMGRLLTVERDDMYHFLFFAPRPEGKDALRAVSLPHRGSSLPYREKVAKLLAHSTELTPAGRAALKADLEEDGIYVTGRAPNRLWLNLTAQPASRGSVQLAPLSIATESALK